MLDIAVIDCETTGLGEKAQVVEVAVVTRTSVQAFLIRPTTPIEPAARAVHHLRDEDLAGAPTMKELMRWVPTLFSADVLVAHNTEFDRRMLLQSGVPKAVLPKQTICTMRCGFHLFPDAPAFGNQTLRYWLGLDIQSPSSHRALSDALVTAAVLRRMLTMKSLEELIELTQTPALLQTVRFGKFRGTQWRDLDSAYLGWITRRDFGADELHTARYWLAQRGG